MTLTKGFIRNTATTALDTRLMDMAKVACNRDGTPRAGVLSGFDAYLAPTDLVATTATMNVSVGAAEFVTTKGKADGVAIFTNDGAVNVPIGAAPASNSRIDVIWVKHNDDTTGDADALPTFGVTAGVAGATPTKPAIPTGALELATLRIYAGTTATNGGSNVLTNTYQMTAMRGGRVRVRTTAERDAWTQPMQGQIVDVCPTAGGPIHSWQWMDAAWVYIGKAYALASGGTNWNVPDTTVTIVSLAVTGSLAGGFTFAGSPNYSLTVPVTGTYRVSAYILFSGNSTGKRDLFVYVNGAQDTRLSARSLAVGVNALPLIMTTDVALSAGDVLDLRAAQTSGVTFAVTSRFLSIERKG